MTRTVDDMCADMTREHRAGFDAIYQQSEFFRGAVDRMLNAPPFFTEAERRSLEDYDGPVVSGDPDGLWPEVPGQGG